MYNENKKRRKIPTPPVKFGEARQKQLLRMDKPRNLAKQAMLNRMALLHAKTQPKAPKLSGVEIANVRIAAAKSTLPTKRRIAKMHHS